MLHGPVQLWRLHREEMGSIVGEIIKVSGQRVSASKTHAFASSRKVATLAFVLSELESTDASSTCTCQMIAMMGREPMHVALQSAAAGDLCFAASQAGAHV